MNGWSLQFEPPDLAGWVWAAVAVTAAIELLRYVVAGRRPGAAAGRFALATAMVVVVALAWVAISGGETAGGEKGKAIGAGALSGAGVFSSHAIATVLLGVLATVWLVRAYRQTTRKLAPGVRGGLLALRLLAVAAVLMLLARPVLQHTTVTRERGVLAILIDDSRSMQVRDVWPGGAPGDGAEPPASQGKPRLAAVREALARGEDALETLATDVDIHWFTFAADLHEWPARNTGKAAAGGGAADRGAGILPAFAGERSAPPLKGEGEQTALAGGLERVRELLGQTGDRPAGVIVISDGRDNLSTDDQRRFAGEWLAAEGVPLYAVGVGSEKPLGAIRGLLARRLDCPPSVAVLNRLPVQAELLATGLAGTDITVELLFDEQVVDNKRVTPTERQELLRVDLAHTPIEGGLHRVAIRARAAGVRGPEGEADLSQYVRVTDDKIQVLYIDRPRYERAAIARALEAAAEIRVTKIDLNRPAGAGLSPLPHSTDEWRVYHVVLIGDIDRSAFAPADLAAIHNLVNEYGRGLAMLGGVRTLGSGAYADTPLAELMPVDLGARGELAVPVAFELTPVGQQHSICRLAEGPRANEEAWKRLPPFEGASRLSGLKPTAELLMRTPEGAPLLVVAETGKARTAAVAFDSTWQWSFADEKGAEAQRRFWRQLVLWLANRRPEVWVSSDRPRYDLARVRSGVEQVLLRAGVTDPTTGRPPEGVRLTGSLTGPDGRRHEIQWVRAGEAYEARPAVNDPGTYHVRVQAVSGDQPWGGSETAFIIGAADPEMVDPTADLEFLRQLAARTRAAGGEYISIDDFEQVLAKVAARPNAAEIRQIRRVRLVDDWPWGWYWILVGLLTVEWIARKRAGLV